MFIRAYRINTVICSPHQPLMVNWSNGQCSKSGHGLITFKYHLVQAQKASHELITWHRYKLCSLWEYMFPSLTFCSKNRKWMVSHVFPSLAVGINNTDITAFLVRINLWSVPINSSSYTLRGPLAARDHAEWVSHDVFITISLLLYLPNKHTASWEGGECRQFWE